MRFDTFFTKEDGAFPLPLFVLSKVIDGKNSLCVEKWVGGMGGGNQPYLADDRFRELFNGARNHQVLKINFPFLPIPHSVLLICSPEFDFLGYALKLQQLLLLLIITQGCGKSLEEGDITIPEHHTLHQLTKLIFGTQSWTETSGWIHEDEKVFCVAYAREEAILLESYFRNACSLKESKKRFVAQESNEQKIEDFLKKNFPHDVADTMKAVQASRY